MPDILLRTELAAKPELVYTALTTQEGLSSAWTDNCTVASEEGSVSEFFRFGPRGDVVYEIRVEKLKRDRLVEWHCVSAGLEEWPGTNVCWELRPGEDGGALLAFSHRGWKRAEGMLPDCAYAWAMIIACLDRYLASGASQPWFQAGVRG